MKLTEWLSVLRAASQPLEHTSLSDSAHRIAARAAALTGNRVSFHVASTPTGVRIHASSRSGVARRALDRAMAEEMAELRGGLATQGRERLTR